MSSGADRFFEEMLDSAKKAARKDVAAEVATVKKELKQTKTDLKVALDAVKSVTKREAAVAKAEQKIASKTDAVTEKLQWREHDISKAEKEIIHLLDQITKIQNEEVITTTTTARKFVKRSKRKGYYSRGLATPQSECLSIIKRRITNLKKREAKQ